MTSYIHPGRPLRLAITDKYAIQLRLLRRAHLPTSDDTHNCWLMTGFRHNGYAQIKIRGKTHWAHRVAYAAWIGPIAAGQTIHHRCHNPACIRPSHLVDLPITAHNTDYDTTETPF